LLNREPAAVYAAVRVDIACDVSDKGAEKAESMPMKNCMLNHQKRSRISFKGATVAGGIPAYDYRSRMSRGDAIRG